MTTGTNPGQTRLILIGAAVLLSLGMGSQSLGDRLGLRVTMIAGAAIYVLGLTVMAAAGGAPALIVSGGLIWIALSCTASSLALLGVVSAAGSLGTLMVPVVTSRTRRGKSACFCS